MDVQNIRIIEIRTLQFHQLQKLLAQTISPVEQSIAIGSGLVIISQPRYFNSAEPQPGRTIALGIFEQLFSKTITRNMAGITGDQINFQGFITAMSN